MSATPTVPVESGDKQATPAKVLLLFIGALLTPLLVTLLVFQLDFAIFGGTLWDALFKGLSQSCDVLFTKVLPGLGAATAAHYTVLTGAVGVLWMTHIYQRVRRTGRCTPDGRFDIIMLVLAGWLFLIYFIYMGTTLTINAPFLTRLALFSAISTVVFSLTVLLAWRADAMGEDLVPRADAKETDANMGPFLMSLLLAVVSAIVTGFYDGESPSVSFFAYQLPNALMHLAANASGVVMALWFLQAVEEQSREKKKAKATPVPAASPVAVALTVPAETKPTDGEPSA